MDAAIRKAKDSIGQIFDKNLHDLVRGIRNHKENESKYITECIDEIKQELKQDNTAVKANAINKLCYLQMIGYDISWAAFNVIEVMSSTKFTHKRIGYLAAAQSFHDGTDVLMLTTNLIRKDLSSQNMYEAGTALSGLACFITPDLARDLVNEIMTLMNSNKPFLRKKAVLIMYKVFLKYPDALRPAFPRLKEKLDDPDPSVQAAAVNVICELARKNPKNYLSLAPIFFKLMTVSTNNWVLIKIIKLFGALTPLEPRLGKKLIEPLTNLINSTSAMSLLYECINTVLAVLVSISKDQPNHESAIQVCLQKLRILIEDSDQNLKYLGLLAMSKILQTNPKAVQAHKDLIMQCLDDKDESIRLRSLDLLYGMVSKKNLMEIIKKLMVHMNKAEGTHYRDELLAKIIDICSQNNYQYVTNFEWYVSVLVELTGMEGTRHGKLLSSQMLDVAIRVEMIRPFVVSQMAILLDNMHVFTTVNASVGLKSSKNATDICEVLFAATWICGEFAVYLNEPFKTMDSMLKSKVTNLPGHIQSVFVQNIFKLYVHIITKIYTASNELESEGNDGEEEDHSDDAFRLSIDGLDECKRITQYVIERTQIFEQSADIEVQERACSMLQILKYIGKIFEKVGENEELREQRIDLELRSLFDGELNPVAPKAQRKVPVPDGLDLDEWINDPPSEPEDNSNETNANGGGADGLTMFAKTTASDQSKMMSSAQNNIPSLSSAAHGKNISYSGGGGGGGSSSGGFGNNNNVSVGAKTIQPELSQEELDKLKESRRIQNDSNPFYIKSKKPETNSLLQTSQSKSGISNYQIDSGVAGGVGGVPQQIRSQSIDLKIPLQIPGVTSSDSYLRMTQIDNENRRLKKKMKKKLESKKSGGKSKKSGGKRDEEDEDEEEEEAPAVKVLDYEMPEGATVESGDEKEKRDVNDPHRALDINLDEPLKENERLYRSAHRSDTQSSLKNKLEEQTASSLPTVSTTTAEAKPKKSKKSKNAESGAGEVGAVVADEVPEKKKKKEKKSSKTGGDESKSSKKSKVKSNQSIDLLISTEPTDDTNQQENYNELLSPVDSQAKSITPKSLHEVAATNGTKTTSDDLDFWLETSKTVDDSKPTVQQESTAEKTADDDGGKKKKSSKKTKSKEEAAEKPIKEKKKSKKSSPSSTRLTTEYDNTLNHDDDHMSINEDRLSEQNEFESYKQLVSNKHLQIKYLVVPNQMNLNQIVIGIKLKNVAAASGQFTNPLVHSFELSLLDTDSLSLIRSQLNMSGDTIKIPFSLNTAEENEAQFYFNAGDCTSVQKLKGTLTYMLKSDDSTESGSIQEKLDLKINIPCSGYLLRSQCSSNEFSNYLTSGDLTCKRSTKLDMSGGGYDSIGPILKTLCLTFSLVVVETLENHASLFTSSIQNHPVCILIKFMDKHHLSIDIKSSNQSLVDNLLDEISSSLLTS